MKKKILFVFVKYNHQKFHRCGIGKSKKGKGCEKADSSDDSSVFDLVPPFVLTDSTVHYNAIENKAGDTAHPDQD